MNHVYLCARAFESKDILNFCRHLFMAIMDKSNMVAFNGTSVTAVVHALTKWDKTSIERNIKRLKDFGEIEKIGHNKIIYNDLVANRCKIVTNHNGYNGAQPAYSQAMLHIAEQINKLIKNEMREESDMTKILKQLDSASRRLETQSAQLENQNVQLENQNKHLESLNAKIQSFIDKFVPEQEKVAVRTDLKIVK